MTQRILFARSKTRIGRLLEPKTIITPPAFGTRVPEHALCVLRFAGAKLNIAHLPYGNIYIYILYVYIYTRIYIHINTYIYIYTYIHT